MNIKTKLFILLIAVVLSMSGKAQTERFHIAVKGITAGIIVDDMGNHTVKVVMIDPEIVVEKLVINPDNEHPSYHGKE